MLKIASVEICTVVGRLMLISGLVEALLSQLIKLTKKLKRGTHTKTSLNKKYTDISK